MNEELLKFLGILFCLIAGGLVISGSIYLITRILDTANKVERLYWQTKRKGKAK